MGECLKTVVYKAEFIYSRPLDRTGLDCTGCAWVKKY